MCLVGTYYVPDVMSWLACMYYVTLNGWFTQPLYRGRLQKTSYSHNCQPLLTSSRNSKLSVLDSQTHYRELSFCQQHTEAMRRSG